MSHFPLQHELFQASVRKFEEAVDPKTGKKFIRVEVKWGQADIVNKNNRRYRKEILEREIDRVGPLCAEGKVLGAAYHPKEDAEIPDISHIWRKIWIEDDGACAGTFDIINTSVGKDVQAVVEAGGQFWLSSRGYGSSTKKTEPINGQKVTFSDLDDNYKLVTPGDIVLHPSVEDAGIRKFIESRLNETDDRESEEGDIMSKELEAKIAEMQTVVDEQKTKIAALETSQVEVNGKLTAAEAKVKELSAVVEGAAAGREKVVGFIRDFIVQASEIDGVLPGKVEGEQPAAEPKKEEAAPAVDKEKEDLKVENEKLKKTEADRVKAEEVRVLQVSLRAKYDELVKTEAFAKYATLIEKELIVDGLIAAESIDALPALMEAAKAKVGGIIAEAQKQKIIESGLEPKGIVGDPEKTDTVKETVRDRANYAEAVRAGYRETFEVYVKNVLKKG